MNTQILIPHEFLDVCVSTRRSGEIVLLTEGNLEKWDWVQSFPDGIVVQLRSNLTYHMFQINPRPKIAPVYLPPNPPGVREGTLRMREDGLVYGERILLGREYFSGKFWEFCRWGIIVGSDDQINLVVVKAE